MELQSYNLRKSSPVFSDKEIVFEGDKMIVKDNDAKKADGSFNHLDIDPLPGKLRNECGFVMNDIMAFETVQSDSMARTIIQNMKVRKGDGVPIDEVFKDDKGTLTDDAKALFDSIIPSNWSSPAEYVRAQKQLAKVSFERWSKRQASLEKKQKQNIEFNDNDSKTSD